MSSLRCKRCKSVLPENLFRCKGCGTWNLSQDTGEVAPIRPITAYRDGKPKRPRFASQHWSAAAFGGGIVPGSTLMIGGEAGAGKSTLMLQLIEAANQRALYWPTEEVGDVGGEGILERCERMAPDALGLLHLVDSPFEWPIELNASLRDYPVQVFDSLSNLQGIRTDEQPDVINAFVTHCAAFGYAMIFLMHVNKDEDFAGLEKLKHLVGCTAILRCSDKKGSERRSLEVIKNRFGPGHSEVDLVMTAQGLVPTQEQVKAWEKERAIREANRLRS